MFDNASVIYLANCRYIVVRYHKSSIPLFICYCEQLVIMIFFGCCRNTTFRCIGSVASFVTRTSCCEHWEREEEENVETFSQRINDLLCWRAEGACLCLQTPYCYSGCSIVSFFFFPSTPPSPAACRSTQCAEWPVFISRSFSLQSDLLYWVFGH